MKFLTYQPPYFDAKSVHVLDKSYVFFISLDGTYYDKYPAKFMIATKGLAYARFISGDHWSKMFALGSLKIDKDGDTGEYFMKFQMEKKIEVKGFEPFGAEEFD
jgi:hypothetical protein